MHLLRRLCGGRIEGRLSELRRGVRGAAGPAGAFTLGGTAEVAIGTNATHASNGQFRASATFTSANTPTLFGNAAAMDDSALTAKETVLATIAVAALPNSADYAIVHLYYIAP